jgi:predicted RNA-binding Zn ribbon-like protein
MNMSKHTDPFEWSGGHPALDFVNTLDERPFDRPIENLATYRDLVRFAELSGLIQATPPSARVVKRARKLREQFFEVLAAVHRGAPIPRHYLVGISSAVRAAHGARILVPSAASRLASWQWSRPTAVDVPLHACALAVESLLMDVDGKRIRKCGAFDCEVYFVDTSKAQRRQWCSMSNCGNREKQRRWRSAAR